MAALSRPTLSPKLSRPAASADRVTVKLSHERTGQSRAEQACVSGEGIDGRRGEGLQVRSFAKKTLGSTRTGRAILLPAVRWRSGCVDMAVRVRLANLDQSGSGCGCDGGILARPSGVRYRMNGRVREMVEMRYA